MTTPKAQTPLRLDQYDLSSLSSAIETLDENGFEYAGTVRTGAAVVTFKYDPDAGLHIVTKIEPRA